MALSSDMILKQPIEYCARPDGSLTRQIVRREVAPPHRHQQLVKSKATASGTVRFGEMAGGTTAECAAVCCCCPFGLANFLVLLAYKLPAGLCRQALRKRRRQRLIRQGLMSPKGSALSGSGMFDEEFQVHPITLSDLMQVKPFQHEKEVEQLEKEMFDRFYGGGFWRSSSQRSESSELRLR